MIDGVNIDWNGDRAKEFVFDTAWEGILRATHYFWDRVQEALNIPNSREDRTRTRNTRLGKKGSAYSVYPSPSKPGEPPRKRTGWLAKHVVEDYQKEQLKAQVGLVVLAKYGLDLELGTRKMLARPWLLATLKKFWPQIQTLAGG